MNQLMKDLGVEDYNELMEFIKENPDNHLVVELKELLQRLTKEGAHG
ncbi:hypothetical protein [Streptococcus suis]|nr:hypothetical protein [Streptococcus suis]MBY4965174.1 hypothetical protein [Streptococcus suis]MDW8777726.1 hypothetical protein [Streptococcus suis]HEL1582375.1 hypothetical protein [Streptococcus suis]HEL2313603.1 hypothetical protein [Streptococcus suis]HEL2734316.1 hypothetical protein [Streptococcus suis]